MLRLSETFVDFRESVERVVPWIEKRSNDSEVLGNINLTVWHQSNRDNGNDQLVECVWFARKWDGK